MKTTQIPPRFLAGSAEPPVATNVGELLDYLRLLPRGLPVYTAAWTPGVMLVARGVDDPMLEIGSVPSELDALAEWRDADK